MVTIASTKNRDYNSFFAQVIDMIDNDYSEPPKILICTLPQDSNDSSVSFYDMNSIDLYQAAGIIQYEATRSAIMEEQFNMDLEYLDDDFNYDVAEDTEDGTEKIR